MHTSTHLWGVPLMDRMPLLLYKSGPLSCSSLDSHSFSFCMLHEPGICADQSHHSSMLSKKQWVMCRTAVAAPGGPS